VNGSHLPSLWWSSCMCCASHAVPSHCMDDSIVLAARRDYAYCSHLSHFPPLIGGQCSALTRANCGDKGKQCVESARECMAIMRALRPLCRGEMVGGERGRRPTETRINPLRLAEGRMRCSD
ncbi:exo-alpha-sialidase, partial [Trypanosoma cruzi]